MLRSCTPLSRHSTHTKLAQPATELPIKAVTIAQMTPMKLTIDTVMPSNVIKRMGFTERLVMPSTASATILRSG